MSSQEPRRFMVLLVDDELRTARRMADMLREDGFAVEFARDGAAAIARLSRSPVPDALVSELTTAHADGAAVGRFARSQRPGLPVVFLTGYPNLFDPDALSTAPAPLLLTKPVDYAALRAALREGLHALPPSGGSGSMAEDSTPPAELQSSPDNARRNTLSGAETVRAIRRP